jgi:acetyl-CoA C-acetyltransferase
MTKAVIVSTARTPLAKSWKGAFNMTHGATLGGHAVKHAVQRAGIAPDAVEDVLMGCANPEGATGANIARQIALMADLPVTVSGATVNRFCSSACRPSRWPRSASSRARARSTWPAAWRASPACSRR